MPDSYAVYVPVVYICIARLLVTTESLCIYTTGTYTSQS